MFIDSHCHLRHTYGAEGFAEGLSSVASSLEYCIDILIDENEIREAKGWEYPSNVLRSAGVYPEFAAGLSGKRDNLAGLRAMIGDLKPDAIGEVGLDYHHGDYGSPAEQEELFRDQLELALELDLPVVIHSRDAFVDTARILASYRFPRGLVMHCFGYGPDEADRFLSDGYYLSFAGNLTYPKALPLQQTAAKIPLDRLLFETDSPYLSPVPHRGKKNYPVNVAHTYSFFATLRGIGLEVLEAAVEENFLRLFRPGKGGSTGSA